MCGGLGGKPRQMFEGTKKYAHTQAHERIFEKSGYLYPKIIIYDTKLFQISMENLSPRELGETIYIVLRSDRSRPCRDKNYNQFFYISPARLTAHGVIVRT